MWWNIQSLIISREGLILTLTILLCPQGRIFLSTPFRKMDGWGWISQHLPRFGGARIQSIRFILSLISTNSRSSSPCNIKNSWSLFMISQQNMWHYFAICLSMMKYHFLSFLHSRPINNICCRAFSLNKVSLFGTWTLNIEQVPLTWCA